MASTKRNKKMSTDQEKPTTKEEGGHDKPLRGVQSEMTNVDADKERMQTHQDLVAQARKERAQQEVGRRLNTIHEMEMQIKSQQSRQPDVPIKDATGRTWEDYHDIFWQVKRGVTHPNDPMNQNRYLAEILGQEREIAWMDEE